MGDGPPNALHVTPSSVAACKWLVVGGSASSVKPSSTRAVAKLVSGRRIQTPRAITRFALRTATITAINFGWLRKYACKSAAPRKRGQNAQLL